MARNKGHIAVIFSILLFISESLGQFAPQAELPGSRAIPANSVQIKFWATNASIQRGYINLLDTNYRINGSNKVNFGTVDACLGPADGKVVSLGDGGQVTLSFEMDISDGPGWDFAVFENGFRSLDDSNLAFLELAYVEVSSDGRHFFRFPGVSLTQDSVQIGGFDFLDARKIHNLAGKYIAMWGTPFDLSDLKSYVDSGLNLHHIKFIRIIDVVGSIDRQLARYDSQGHKINDPFPTPYASGGFDLDAVGVKNYSFQQKIVSLYPNPAINHVNVYSPIGIKKILIFNTQGKIIYSKKLNNDNFVKISVKNLESGLYFCLIQTNRPIGLSFIKL